MIIAQLWQVSKRRWNKFPTFFVVAFLQLHHLCFQIVQKINVQHRLHIKSNVNCKYMNDRRFVLERCSKWSNLDLLCSQFEIRALLVVEFHVLSGEDLRAHFSVFVGTVQDLHLVTIVPRKYYVFVSREDVDVAQSERWLKIDCFVFKSVIESVVTDCFIKPFPKEIALRGICLAKFLVKSCT